MTQNLIPQQWHLYTVNLNPRVGTKPGKQRPCLSIQPREAAEEGVESTVVIPLTSRVLAADAYPLRIHLPKGTCGLKTESDLMIDQILAWDNKLFRDDLGIVSELIQQKVKQAIKDFLDLY